LTMERPRKRRAHHDEPIGHRLESPKALTAKDSLAVKFNELVEERGLRQVEVAAITGMTQPKVSQLRQCKLQNISLERLMQALVSLGQCVEIIVRPARRSHEAGISVDS
jgi:predicted XRE-type DNA-binding protein